MSELKTVGVVGAGVMGRGLSQALIATGHRVVLVDRSPAILEAARAAVRAGLMSAALLAGGAKEKLAVVMARLDVSVDLAALDRADAVIENVTELWETKAALYPRLDAVCRADAIFAANTSTIPIDAFANLVAAPQRVVGMHFMNPVPARDLVEIIRGPRTRAATLALAERLLRQMGKAAIVVGDGPGFALNRVLMLTVNEAIRVVEDGVADATSVDALFRGCVGHAMGPLATGDLIGLDTILLSLRSLQELTGDARFAPSPLLVEMVAAGRLGRKAGAGFFDYGAEERAHG